MNKEKQALIYSFVDSNKTVRLCNGKGFQSMKRNDFLNVKYKSDEYVFIPQDPKQKDMKICYKNFTDTADALKKASGGKINLYKTGSFVMTALDLFYQSTKHIVADPIQHDEAEFIEKSKMASLIWSEPYEGECYQFDFVSFYPSLMRSKNILFPIKRGEFKSITQKTFDDHFDEKGFVEMGIYRCTVEITKPKLFRENLHGFYTYIDLRRAKELNFKINITVDDKPNFLYYSRDKMIKGCHLFSSFVDDLFELKKKKVPGSKDVLNCLWGALGKKDAVNIYSHWDDDEEIKISSNKIIDKIENINENTTMIKLINKHSVYKSNFARLCPFLIAKGRYVLSKALEPHIEFVKRVHTDSMYTTKKLNVVVGENLFDLAYKGFCEEAVIVNNGKPQGEFK